MVEKNESSCGLDSDHLKKTEIKVGTCSDFIGETRKRSEISNRISDYFRLIKNDSNQVGKDSYHASKKP